jgi:hypothetical protein
MAEMVVGFFNTRAEADAARQDLVERGFDQTNIRIAGGDEVPASQRTIECACMQRTRSRALEWV